MLRLTARPYNRKKATQLQVLLKLINRGLFVSPFCVDLKPPFPEVAWGLLLLTLKLIYKGVSMPQKWVIVITFDRRAFVLVDDTDPNEFEDLFMAENPIIFPSEELATQRMLELDMDLTSRVVALIPEL